MSSEHKNTINFNLSLWGKGYLHFREKNSEVQRNNGRGPHITDVVTTGKNPGNLLDAMMSIGLAWTHRRRKLSEPVLSRSTQQSCKVRSWNIRDLWRKDRHEERTDLTVQTTTVQRGSILSGWSCSKSVQNLFSFHCPLPDLSSQAAGIPSGRSMQFLNDASHWYQAI